MTGAYGRAGMSAAEIEHLSRLVAAVESADPAAPWVAVERADVLAVVAVLDRLVDAGQDFSCPLGQPPMTGPDAMAPDATTGDELAWLHRVGMRVRLARVARGESQAELGARARVSRVSVGSNHPASVLAYIRLASALAVPLADLSDGST